MVNDMKSKPDQSNKLTREGVIKVAKLLAQPIDFEELEKSGLLVKEGAWFRVKDINLLPDHVREKITEITVDKKGTKVKLTSHKRAEKLLKKLK